MADRPTLQDILDAEAVGYAGEGGLTIYLTAERLRVPRVVIERDVDGVFDDALIQTQRMMMDTAAVVEYDDDYSVATIKLGYPTKEVQTVTLKRPSVRDRLMARKGGKGTGALASNISAVTGVSESALRQLDIADWVILSGTFATFPSRSAGGTGVALGPDDQAGG